MVARRNPEGTPLDLIERTLPTPEENLALDLALLRRLDALCEGGETGGEVLRFWTCDRPVVILGRSSRTDEDVDLSSCREAGVPVLRRASGGGTVVLAPGCLNFSLVLGHARRPGLRDVGGSYAAILEGIVRALRLPGLAPRGVSDLAWHGRKVSGNAQLRGRHGLVHHGTLLHAFDPALPCRFLHEPRKQPPYRARRAHCDFIGNLPLPAEAIVERLAEAWNAHPAPVSRTAAGSES